MTPLPRLAPFLVLAPFACSTPRQTASSPAVTAVTSASAAVPAPPPRPVTAAPSTPPPAPPAPCEPGAVVRLDQLSEPVRGSFSAAGRDEIAGDMTCDDRSGLALVRRVGANLELVRIDLRADLRMSCTDCRALRTAGGRDLLICREDTLAYSENYQTLVVVDYARAEGHDRVQLIAVSDATDTSCGGGSDVVVATLGRYDLVDVNHDGLPDVRVRVGAARVRVPPRPDCQMGREGSGEPPKVPRPPWQIVELLLQGETLVPTARSARVLAKLKALSR